MYFEDSIIGRRTVVTCWVVDVLEVLKTLGRVAKALQWVERPVAPLKTPTGIIVFCNLRLSA